MKKILKIFLLAFTLFSAIPYQVDADCGIGPIEMDAVVSNKNGAKLYDWIDDGYKLIDKTLDYGTNIIILYESQGYAMIEVSDEDYYIKATDYTYKKDMKAESDSYIKYYAYADTIIRNVPSFYSYKIVETIPANTYFDISGTDEYVNSEDGQWAVASYNGKKGWVYVGGCNLAEGESITVAYKYEKPITAYVLGNYNYETANFTNVLEGYKILGDNSTKESITLKYKDKVQILYENSVGHNRYYYIKTDSINGIWVYNILLYTEDDMSLLFEKFESPDDYRVYSYNDLKKVDISINEHQIYNTKFSVLSLYNELAYVVEINGKNYWLIYSYSESPTQLLKETITLTLKEDYKYYSYNWFNYDSQETGIISKGDYICYKLKNIENVYYIPDYGFICLEDEFMANDLEDDKTSNNVVEEDEDFIDEVISPKKFVTYCVAAAALVALGAATTIVIMHRNKKQDKNSIGE